MNARLLVRTPAQLPGESLLGFVLRTSEDNGYDTPWRLFQLAGIAQPGMLTCGLDTAALAAVLGRDPAALSGYGPAAQPDGMARASLAGQPLSPRQLRLASPRLCPECVVEGGFIPAWTDLSAVDACPVHQRSLVGACPHCGHKLSWFRPALLACRCGYDLGKVRGPGVGAAHSSLLAYVAGRVMGHDAQDACGLPGRELRAMSLRGLLRLIQALGRFRQAADPHVGSEAAFAGQVLSRWPDNFFALLRALGPNDSQRSASGLRAQFETLYRALFKGKTRRSETKFLRRAFIQFGRTHWGQAQLDLKLLDEEDRREEGRFVSLATAASRLGVTQASARRFLDRELLSACALGPAEQPRYVVDLQTLHVPPRAPGKSYGERAAARRLGLPVSVLQALRRSGHFEVRQLGASVATFHEADIAAFEGRVAALAVGPYPPAEKTISLAQALRSKFKSEDGKAQLVRAVFDGKLRIVGFEEESVTAMLLAKQAVMRFVEAARAEAFGGALTPAEAARRLQCDRLVIPELARTGHLEGRSVRAGLRVTAQSVEQFHAAYRSVAGLAAEVNTSSKKLVAELVRAGIPLLEVPRGHAKTPQPFVRRGDLNGWPRYPAAPLHRGRSRFDAGALTSDACDVVFLQ